MQNPKKYIEVCGCKMISCGISQGVYIFKLQTLGSFVCGFNLLIISGCRVGFYECVVTCQPPKPLERIFSTNDNAPSFGFPVVIQQAAAAKQAIPKPSQCDLFHKSGKFQ